MPVVENAHNIVTIEELTDPAAGWVAFVHAIQARELAALTVIANGVTDAIEAYLKRPVVARSRTDYLDGNDSNEVSLGMYPTTITSLELLHWTDGSVRYAYVPTDYNLDPETGVVMLYRLVFPRGRRNLKAVHSPGWAFASVPSQVKLAARFWCNKLYKAWQGGAADDEIQSQSLEGMNTSYFVGEMPKKVEGMLRPLRIKWVMA